MSRKAEAYHAAIQKAQEIRAVAAQEIREEIESAIAELNELGFDYYLASEVAKKAATTGKKQRAASTKPKFCQICNRGGHDARSHRWQDPLRKFTAAELEAKGLPKGE